MLLYLVRHAEATQLEPRPLSPFGRRQAEDLAVRVLATGAAPVRILHSGKSRALQTAGIIAAALGPEEMREVAGLGPEDDIERGAEMARESSGDLMLVGHLPYMGELAALLLRAKAPVNFPTATIVCLEGSGSRWTLQWKITGDPQ